ncbi:MAG: amidase family protein [Rhodovarius sp.]|nr:amidase family protein [Rhodovarius sp.]MCX7932552.1 amidase family protein [Rhodovarius sp.]MDW8313343.1 amidase family protein [Rhodovarius sp.]
MSDVYALSATEIAARVRARELRAVEVVAAALARLDQVNPRINAVVEPLHEEAMAAAAEVDAALARGEDPGLMAGVPVTVKVNVDQKGHATTNGLTLQKDHIAHEDNPVVANLRRAGAIIIGRTNTPAFSVRWFCSNKLHGHTRNPRNPAITPGGSSGGAGAAVAAGIGAVAHGTDIGGSIRYPAYACGVHGLRPTLGRVPAWNPSLPERDIGPQLMAVSGPLARSIADLRLAFHAMAQRDVRDPWWTPVPFELGPAPRRAALVIRPDGMPVVPEVEAALRDAARRLQDRGWTVVEMDNLPPLREPARLQTLLWMANMHLGGLEAVRREGEPAALAVHEHLMRLHPPPDLASLMQALTARAGFVRQWQAFFERYPVALCPVSGELPFPDQLDTAGFETFQRILEAQLTQIGLPLMGLPGLAVATGMVGRTPVGVQLLAGRYREDLLFAAAADIEAGGVPPSPVEPE